MQGLGTFKHNHKDRLDLDKCFQDFVFLRLLVIPVCRHISVDVYGKGRCSDPGLKCDKGEGDQCLQMLNTSYKVSDEVHCPVCRESLLYFQFYLSLENSLCADYVTEKFWKVLPYNVIPVVLNGANMSNFAPRNSYIDFKDFNNNIAGKLRKGVTV